MYALKIQRLIEEDAPGFEQWLRDQVKRVVEEKETTVQAIATRAGISSGYLYRLMKGKQDVVSADVVAKLEEVLESRYVN